MIATGLLTNGSDMETTILNNKIVMKNRVLLYLDENEVLKKNRKYARKIIEA